MKLYTNGKEVKPVQMAGHHTYMYLSTENGCVCGCCAGISVYTRMEYLTPSVHEDQEGFFVLEGSGWGIVGENEFRLEPKIAFIVPKGVEHCFKRDEDSEAVKLFWFHAAV